MPTPPQYCPTPRELDDLELLVTGALAPLTRFDEPGSPVTLTLPPEVASAAAEAGAVELVDPEGLPLARVSVPGGAVEALTHVQYGPFRRHYLSPAQVRGAYAGRTFVPVTDALTEAQVEEVRALGPVVLLAYVGAGTPALSPVGLLRASLAAAALLPDAAVVAVPLAAHGDAELDHRLGVQVARTYAAGDPVHALAEPADDDAYPPSIAVVVDFDRPEPADQGLVLFFTGLSGSGKSTLARALMDRLLEQGTRTVTSLDGDVVRRNLSAGLTFSKADRETNIRRIGWVAAEISRHGGVAVCSPIAPFDETRQQVRAMVEDAGGAFFLVHVATPLEECERRDRKGLYAKARRGEIPEFTGISSPYEEPADADVRVDTTGRTIDDALGDVVEALREAGYLDLADPAATTAAAPAPTPAPTVADRPLRVLFVCTANICRSPFMELLARRLAGTDASVTFASAGTHGFRDHPMDEVMSATLAARGAEAAGFRSRAITRQMVDEADLVLTAEAAHRSFILDEQPAAFRKVFTLGQFAEAARAADPTLTGRALITTISGRRGAASPELDVADPYRLGPEAAERAAAGIEELLEVVVPRLAAPERAEARS
ncbi:adenylyl-sulfate kinase [Nocardioides sp. zg-579]|uniref:Adenylyl-sulfate kinase n=1 Tax=Nocardioides marmotae TaxID=2663857 RepID=A0A6I3JCH0_9ACTN|nr:adenylyl-sulfate kinase [Nocardioides marmotae]MCR6032188.1 adenylyl-sulfate kinase [Gordonia jinghuaiqii]MTB95834.1 adenylyl-sulfate kinase [Nocardioides marmotae]QKE02814.1 adenylyl-sulfate kinase [Nocardioides marmotae]